jgi:glutamate synthase (NADPH/NADH) small chain
VTIKQVEVEIIDNAFDEGWVKPQPPHLLTGKVAVGSGPRACRRPAADPGRPRRHRLRAGRPHRGLLRYGIPEFKMEKRHIDRRLAQMEAEGTASGPA